MPPAEARVAVGGEQGHGLLKAGPRASKLAEVQMRRRHHSKRIQDRLVGTVGLSRRYRSGGDRQGFFQLPAADVPSPQPVLHLQAVRRSASRLARFRPSSSS
mgnify:CR=1 FL=1